MQQIYRRTPMPKCDFNKVAKQLYWNRISALVFSCKFTAYFQNIFSQEYLWTAASVSFIDLVWLLLFQWQAKTYVLIKGTSIYFRNFNFLFLLVGNLKILLGLVLSKIEILLFSTKFPFSEFDSTVFNSTTFILHQINPCFPIR